MKFSTVLGLASLSSLVAATPQRSTNFAATALSAPTHVKKTPFKLFSTPRMLLHASACSIEPEEGGRSLRRPILSKAMRPLIQQRSAADFRCIRKRSRISTHLVGIAIGPIKCSVVYIATLSSWVGSTNHCTALWYQRDIILSADSLAVTLNLTEVMSRLLTAVNGIPYTIASFVGMMLIDRWRRRGAMLIGMSGLCRRIPGPYGVSARDPILHWNTAISLWHWSYGHDLRLLRLLRCWVARYRLAV